MTDFDILCEKYEKILDYDLRIGGESHAYFIEFKALWIKEFLNRLCVSSDINILDVGCGLGGMNGYINKHIPDAVYYGIDISSKSVQKAHCQNKGLRQSYYSNYDGANIPFKKDSFDVVILAGVLHHMQPGARQSILGEIYKVLKSGGFLFIFEHNGYNPVVRHIVKKCVIDKDANLLTLRTAKNYLLQANFEIIRKDYIIFFPGILRKLRFLENKLSWLPFGAQYAVVGKKQR